MVDSFCLYDTIALPLATREAGGAKALSEGLTSVDHEDQKIGKAFQKWLGEITCHRLLLLSRNPIYFHFTCPCFTP